MTTLHVQRGCHSDGSHCTERVVKRKGATENTRPGSGRPQKIEDLTMLDLTLPGQIAGGGKCKTWQCRTSIQRQMHHLTLHWMPKWCVLAESYLTCIGVAKRCVTTFRYVVCATLSITETQTGLGRWIACWSTVRSRKRVAGQVYLCEDFEHHYARIDFRDSSE